MANILHYLFLCDGTKCANGLCKTGEKVFGITCAHTSDVKHARNYEQIPRVDVLEDKFEKKVIRRGNDKHIYYFEKGE